ncbi:MAG: AAA family ATPase [Chloroflexota bacterium]|nr:AAA family ATPase [Chloroflexota bacterium]MDE2883841.1 AAA family ATPase [Chloroflexota bacterium]
MLALADSIWLITGIPGVGKTTVSRELAARLGASAHIEVDLVREMVVSGYLAPGQEPLAVSDAQLDLGAHNAALLAGSFMDAGFTPIVDDVVLRPRLARYREVLAHRLVRLVVLAPPVGVAVDRDRGRVEKHVAGRFAYLDRELREQMLGLGLWLDTSGASVVETVDVISRRADEALLAPVP